MRKRFAILFGFLCLGLLDSVFAYGIPLNFEFTGFSIIWHWYLIGLLVFTRDKPILLRFLIGSLAGLAYGMLFSGSFFYNWIMFMLLSVLIGFFKPLMNGFGRQFGIYFAFILAFDLLSYAFMQMKYPVQISLFAWLYRMELISLFTTALCIGCVMFMDNVMVRFFLIQRHLERKQEKKMMRRMQASKTTEYL